MYVEYIYNNKLIFLYNSLYKNIYYYNVTIQRHNVDVFLINLIYKMHTS